MKLNERIADMQSRGMSRSEALKRALDELGDETEADDAPSCKRRTEVIARAYMRRVPLDRLHAVGYTLAGAVLLFGGIVGAIQMLRTGSVRMLLGSLTAFVVPAAGAFVFLGLTQETARRQPMRAGRAALCAAAGMLLLFGAFVSGIAVLGV